MFALSKKALAKSAPSAARWASTAASKDKYKVVVVGAGTPRLSVIRPSCIDCHGLLPYTGSAGLSVANQIYYRFKSAGKALNEDDIAIVDAAEYHYYQVRKIFATAIHIIVTHVYPCGSHPNSPDGM